MPSVGKMWDNFHILLPGISNGITLWEKTLAVSFTSTIQPATLLLGTYQKIKTYEIKVHTNTVHECTKQLYF